MEVAARRLDAAQQEKEEEDDLFRDTPLRYMGYANEVGESFRSLVSPGLVKASYVVAFGYVFMDVVDKSIKSYRKETATNQSNPMKSTSKEAVDCLVWQTLASVLVPGFTINRICKLSSVLMTRSNVPALMRANKVLTTGIGLASIPFIIHPIDHLIHWIMDASLRPALGIEPFLTKNKPETTKEIKNK